MHVIHTFNIKACRKTGLGLTGFDRFFGGFLNFKISKKPRPLCLGPRKDRDRGPVFIRFSPVRSPVFYRSLRPDLETLTTATQLQAEATAKKKILLLEEQIPGCIF